MISLKWRIPKSPWLLKNTKIGPIIWMIWGTYLSTLGNFHVFRIYVDLYIYVYRCMRYRSENIFHLEESRF